MEVVRLTKLESNPVAGFGHNGYTTEYIYRLNDTDTVEAVAFELIKTESAYTKTWVTTDEDIREYNEIIAQGHSFGAFEGNEITGWIICDYREWNNTLYIENILVAEEYRNRGVGRKLIETVIRHAKNIRCRLIELETQHTNFPAITFYRKQGFKITGFNSRLYDGEDSHEIALFMTKDVMFREEIT